MVNLLGGGGNEIEVRIKGTARDLKQSLSEAAASVQSFKQVKGSTELNVDTTGVTEGVARAKRQVNSFDSVDADADLGANTGGLIAKLQLLQGRADEAADEVDNV